MSEPQVCHEFEHTCGEPLPEPYHLAFVGLTSQMIDPLLRAVGAKRGVKVIDIASGPGHVAAAAAKRGAIVLGVDFSAAMVAHAQRLHPAVEFREGNAEQLPLGNGLFDAAVMNFGILHFGQPESGLTEDYRGLRVGGRRDELPQLLVQSELDLGQNVGDGEIDETPLRSSLELLPPGIRCQARRAGAPRPHEEGLAQGEEAPPPGELAPGSED